MTKLPNFSKERAAPRQEAFDNIKSEAMIYIQETLFKFEDVEEPDQIHSAFKPTNWKAFSVLKKRNLIQLFFLNVKAHHHIQLITYLPETQHFMD
jgi:hypothetical protein